MSQPLKFFFQSPLLLLLLLSPILTAATHARIELTNGDHISGVLWQVTDESLLVDTLYGAYRLPLAMVTNIRIEGATLPARLYLTSGEVVTGQPMGGDGHNFHIQVDQKEKVYPWQQVQRLEFELPVENSSSDASTKKNLQVRTKK